ncbi:hypothetical protein A7K94_0220690 [Modestobacter sp. VKM Ac-2676]|nr:hypothetical protein A7K94_0220690 [Modestobacter sp. VKM Ac-2676]
MVLAGSNHATGYTPRPGQGLLREVDAPHRPDTYYGGSKVAMEGLGALYVDRYGMDVVCLRIGSAFAEPTTLRQLATWLSPTDQVGLVDAALRAPSPGFAVVWGGVGQHPQLVGPHRGPGAGLPAGGRRRGVRRCADRRARRAGPHRSGAHPGGRGVHPARLRRGPDRGAAAVTPPAVDQVLTTARDWADDDPHDGDRAEIAALIEAADTDELARRFAGPLTFGTAGTRCARCAGCAGVHRGKSAVEQTTGRA